MLGQIKHMVTLNFIKIEIDSVPMPPEIPKKKVDQQVFSNHEALNSILHT